MHSAMLLDSLWVLLTRLVMRAANFAVFILLARSLSVGEFGFYGYVMSTALVLSVAFDVGPAPVRRLGDRAGAGGRSGGGHAPGGTLAGAGRARRPGLLAAARHRRLRRRAMAASP